MIGNCILFVAELTGIVWTACALALAIGIGRLKLPESEAVTCGEATASLGKPTVSVLIAARNEEHNIGRCLEAMSRQDYPDQLREIVVIDDNSTDGTAGIVKSYLDRIKGLRLIDAGELRPGMAPKKSALIKGIHATTGEIILTTDADCEPPPGWITGIVEAFSTETDSVVGYSPLRGAGQMGKLSRFDGLVSAVISAGSIGLGIAGSAVGRNFAYRRRAWQDAGGFGGSAAGASGDDDLLLQRIARNGGRIAFAIDPGTFVPARGKASFTDWWCMKRRHFSAGKRYTPSLKVLGSLLYLFNPALIAMFVFAMLGHIDPILAAAVWGAKLSVDGLALARGVRLFNERGWIVPWLIGEIISPFILTILIPASLVGKIAWKGRKLER